MQVSQAAPTVGRTTADHDRRSRACEGADMATIHRTTMVPTKLELIGDWLTRQRWYRDTGLPPTLTRAGGFRLDDPAGDVGIESIFVIDGTEGAETTYHVPLAYRGAPLPGAEEWLLGTSEHGVLGRRWIYDAAHDPVAVAQLLDFVCAGTEAQDQDESDTPDPSVGRHWATVGRLTASSPLRVSDTEPGRTSVAVELIGDSSAAAGQRSLDLVRVLQDGAAVDSSGGPILGRVEADWTRLGGNTARGPVAVVR
jgi:hypothetical protein